MMIQPQTQTSTIASSDEIHGVKVSLDVSVRWLEWRGWLRPILVQGQLRPYGLNFDKLKGIFVMSLDSALPRISGMVTPDEAHHHFLLACDLDQGFVLCLPISLVKQVDYERLYSQTRPDDIIPAVSSDRTGIWQDSFEVFPHFCTSDFVSENKLLIDERRSLRRLFEGKLHPKFFNRIAPALEYRN